VTKPRFEPGFSGTQVSSDKANLEIASPVVDYVYIVLQYPSPFKSLRSLCTSKPSNTLL